WRSCLRGIWSSSAWGLRVKKAPGTMPATSRLSCERFRFACRAPEGVAEGSNLRCSILPRRPSGRTFSTGLSAAAFISSQWSSKVISMRTKRIANVILVWLLVMQSLSARAAEVRYFPVQAGDHPHDVAPAPDGTVWYTGQRAGVLGRLDPKTGGVERIPLGKSSAPHGVIVGPDGAAWVTDSGQNAIVRVDPIRKEEKAWP